MVSVEIGVQFPLRIFSHIRYQMVDPRGFCPAESWVRSPYVTQTTADRVVSGGLSRNRGKKDWVDIGDYKFFLGSS